MLNWALCSVVLCVVGLSVWVLQDRLNLSHPHPPTSAVVHLHLLYVCVCGDYATSWQCMSTSICHFLAIWICDVCDWARRRKQTHTYTDTSTLTPTHIMPEDVGSSGQTFCQLWRHFTAAAQLACRFKPFSAQMIKPDAGCTYIHTYVPMLIYVIFVVVVCWPHIPRNYE